MSVDTKMYLDPKWELRDIVDTLESHLDLVEKKKYVKMIDNRKRLHKYKTEVVAVGDMPNCYNMYFELKDSEIGSRAMFVITNTNSPIGTATYLSLGYNDESTKIMHTIANVLGGAVIDDDSKENVEFVNGMLSVENGLSYFIKYAAIHNKVENEHDILGFLRCIKEWEDNIFKSSSTYKRTINGELKEFVERVSV